VLVPWRDAGAIATEIISLSTDAERRGRMCARAMAHGVGMTWEAVATKHAETLVRACAAYADRRGRTVPPPTLARRSISLPDINLSHVRAMTDDTGICSTRPSAFRATATATAWTTTRALLLMTLLDDARIDEAVVVRTLHARYLAFVSHAFDRQSRRFRNFLSYERQWLESAGSEDSHGRTQSLWAPWSDAPAIPAGTAWRGICFTPPCRRSPPSRAPRAWAYTLLGICEYQRAFQGDSGRGRRPQRARRPIGWPAGAHGTTRLGLVRGLAHLLQRLSQALIAAAAGRGGDQALAARLRTLEWLVSVQRSPDGHFAAIGSNGFYERDGAQASFDQQPVEACATVGACLEAYRATDDPRWAKYAQRAFGWFLGENQLHQWDFDPATGGCRDGVHHDRLNQNQGGEATLSFLMALYEMRGGSEVLVPQLTLAYQE
jgi:hypothetical protein